MLTKATATAILLLCTAACARGATSDVELNQRFTGTVKPFLARYCIDCHGGDKPEAHYDLNTYSDLPAVVKDQARWALLLEKLTKKEMPPKEAEEQPAPEARKEIVTWLTALRRSEAEKHAGDPG